MYVWQGECATEHKGKRWHAGLEMCSCSGGHVSYSAPVSVTTCLFIQL